MNQSPEKLMTNQFITNQKINDLLELASEYITCGPECQENKKSQQLYDEYLNSQKVLKTAPEKVEKNKQNYYIYTYGPEYYADVKKKELSENATEIMSKISDEFNIQIETALIMNNLLKITDTSSCLDQYPVIQAEINNELEKKKNNVLVNDRKTYYSNESIERLELWNKFLSFIYYFLILVFLILCFPKSIMEFIKYGFVIGLAFLYPLMINYLFSLIYNNNIEIIISIIYFIILLIIILFILYKIATTFKYVLINLTEIMTKMYKFSN
jgi:predicted RNase H-related nuclease YkuK (DUF458 family)